MEAQPPALHRWRLPLAALAPAEHRPSPSVLRSQSGPQCPVAQRRARARAGRRSFIPIACLMVIAPRPLEGSAFSSSRVLLIAFAPIRPSSRQDVRTALKINAARAQTARTACPVTRNRQHWSADPLGPSLAATIARRRISARAMANAFPKRVPPRSARRLEYLAGPPETATRPSARQTRIAWTVLIAAPTSIPVALAISMDWCAFHPAVASGTPIVRVAATALSTTRTIFRPARPLHLRARGDVERRERLFPPRRDRLASPSHQLASPSVAVASRSRRVASR